MRCDCAGTRRRWSRTWVCRCCLRPRLVALTLQPDLARREQGNSVTGAAVRGVGVTVVRCASFAVASVLLCLRFASNGCLAPSWPAAADLAPPCGCFRTQLRAGLRFWPRRLTGSLAWLPRCGRSPAPLGSLASAAAKPGGALLGGAPPPSPALLCYVTLTREQRCIGRAHRPSWPPTVPAG